MSRANNTFTSTFMTPLKQNLTIDCGSYKTIICNEAGDKVLDELSLAYVYPNDNDAAFFGTAARLTHGKGWCVAPLMEESSENERYAKRMLPFFVDMAAGKVLGLFKPRIKVVVCALPLGQDAAIIRKMAASIKADDLVFIDQPIAAARGLGLDVTSPEGKMILDIGHKTTDIAVISNGRIIASSSIPIAGHRFTEDIKQYLEEQCGIIVGEQTASRVKYEVGAAITDLPQDQIPDKFYVRGSNLERTDWQEGYVGHEQIASALDHSLSEIEAEAVKILKEIPQTLYKDISRTGIWLVGGSARLSGIEKRFSEGIGVRCNVPVDPGLVTARGASSFYSKN